jgi:hypothetical protein
LVLRRIFILSSSCFFCSRATQVIMITGDHPVIAKAIARQVNIITHDTVDDVARADGVDVKDIAADDPRVNAVVVQGSQLQAIFSKPADEAQQFWDATLSKADVVFARTSPQQKLIIVEACQNRGHTVAVTGLPTLAHGRGNQRSKAAAVAWQLNCSAHFYPLLLGCP